jgi:small subunit ribosomal protein S3
MTAERKFLTENLRRLLLKEYIRKEVERAGFGGIEIQRTPLGTRVTLFTEKPGLVIGKGGEVIKKLTETIEQKFKFDNPQIAVEEIKNPELNPHLMARKLAEALERGWNFRRAAYSVLQRIMAAGARGCQVIISGKITGERHKSAKFTAGHIKYCGEPAELFMQEGYGVALTKPGIMGVKIKIMPPDIKLPDEISIKKKNEVKGS